MGLAHGDVHSLVSGGCKLAMARSVLRQILRALSYLAARDLIHRDVKPSNILWKKVPGEGLVFQLADFGLCNRASVATTAFIGTYNFWAPEMIISNCPQSPKMDVWSLLVTFLWIYDVKGFRRVCIRLGMDEVKDKIASLVKTERALRLYAPMAAINPAERASAQEMLANLYNE